MNLKCNTSIFLIYLFWLRNTQYNNIWVIDDTLTTVAFFSKPKLFSDPKENWCNLSICSFSNSSLIQENKRPHYDLAILLSPFSIYLFESYDIKLNYKIRIWYKINFMYIKGKKSGVLFNFLFLIPIFYCILLPYLDEIILMKSFLFS